MQDFEQKEKEFEEQVNSLPRKSFKKVFAEIEPRLKKKEGKKRKPQNFQIILAAAASILLIVTGILLGYFLIKDNPEYRYEDDRITTSLCAYEDILNQNNLFSPNLSLLDDKTYQVGKHNETNESVYFIVFGIYDDGISFREIKLFIILKKEYKKVSENDYQNLPNNFSISDKTVFYSQSQFEEPFFSYCVRLEFRNVRYYFDYKTIEEDDVGIFFREFLI